MGDLTLAKVASSLNRMQVETENRQALEMFSSYGKEDQVKIAKCFEFLKQSEVATKTAHEQGELAAEEVIGAMAPARRLKVAIELAHFNELVSNEDLAKQAEEAAAAGALMSNLFVDYVKNAGEMPPQFAAMKEKMKDSKDGDGDGKKLEGSGKKDKKDKDDKDDKEDKED